MVEDEARNRLGAIEADAFLTRLEQLSADILEPLSQVYGAVTDAGKFATELVLDALHAAAERPAALRLLDRRREIDPAWFQRSRMIGYVCYTDQFAGTLAGVRQHLDYLAELGVTYLHLMPLLRSRDGENDGGYAVADYDATDPRIGTMTDLQALAGDLHERGMVLCIDLVLNHTAAEHKWARKALAGEPGYRERYLIYPDRTEPDRYERTLPEVFPDLAPGSFTEVSGLGWVWTTFHDYQWDLNYANPAVFRAMLGTMFALANRGVDVLRVDAAPFLWKRIGTDGQNQPEAHALLRAFRALTRGALFQDNPVTGDSRISGMAASLSGIEAALEGGDPGGLTAAIRRPLMDWDAAARRHDPGSLEGRVFAAIRGLSAARRLLLALRSGGRTELLPTENRSVLAYRRTHPRSAPFLALTNFSDVTQAVDAGIIARAGLYEPAHVHSSTGRPSISAGRIELAPWSFLWLTGT
jgi:glycosidase